MWPWGHLAVGYLAYAGWVRYARGEGPGDPAVLALAVGTQFPDLVDKPLAWTVGVLPNGRSLGHSLLVAALLLTVLSVAAGRRASTSDPAGSPESGATVPGAGATSIYAFGVGYLSHLFADALGPLLAGEYHYLGFLGWPVIPPVEYATDPGILAHLAAIDLTPAVAAEVVLLGIAAVVWVRDGRPGWGPIRHLGERMPSLPSR